ncbi:SpoIIE family protein phosphatase [Arthrobacter sp. ISL-85]|uniref:PP2C family protein-serine/threonine phosphatase n=1 Tax=Arthrobacter sp. ISL-85 TaxID=2819115 RepID=UPI001BECE3C4|nr:SpoIIE family protein phosphatase [Arthrobacter sp. ISL-85]MBT2566285.1 SpoIIE family protein phosphatase [Arthrobacter sp. ISL-85]
MTVPPPARLRDLRIAPDEPARLKSLAETGLLDSPAEEGFDRITRLAQKLFGVSAASVALIGEDRQFLKSVVGDLEVNAPREVSFCTHTILTPHTLVVEDAQQDERFSNNPLVLGQPNIRFYAGQPLQGPGGHNIGTLCIIDQEPRTFTEEQKQVLHDLAAIAQREINVRTDLKNGAKIQQAHLPGSAPSLPGYDISAYCRPAGELSGDFYDWHVISGRFRFTLADVMGKGTGPAILTATVRAGLRATAALDPAAALTAVSEELLTNLARSESFVTAFHAELDPATGTVRYSDAGHGLAHHVTGDGAITRLPTSNAPLGIMAGMQWHTRGITLNHGDSLIIPSDGVLELLHEDLDDLAAALKQLTTSTDIPADLNRMAIGSGSPSDDVTVLILRRT